MWKSSGWQEWFRVRKPEDDQPPDYGKYVLTGREWLICIAQASLITVMFAWFFYHSLRAFILLFPILAIWKNRKVKQLAEARKKELSIQFRDLILSLSSGLQTGYSMENAFLEAGKDVMDLYGRSSLIGLEAERIRRGIQNNVPLEELLLNLGRRSCQEDMENFAEVFSIARKSGGNVREIIRKSAEVTGERIAVQKEIQTLLSSRKYEQKIMNLIPILIIAYLQLTSRGYFDVLYGNLPGILIMTGALTVYLTAWYLSERIVEIEV